MEVLKTGFVPPWSVVMTLTSAMSGEMVWSSLLSAIAVCDRWTGATVPLTSGELALAPMEARLLRF